MCLYVGSLIPNQRTYDILEILTFLFSLAFTELPAQMLGRPIMWRQTAFCFYRPGALALANTLADIPFTVPKIFVFCVIVEFA